MKEDLLFKTLTMFETPLLNVTFFQVTINIQLGRKRVDPRNVYDDRISLVTLSSRAASVKNYTILRLIDGDNHPYSTESCLTRQACLRNRLQPASIWTSLWILHVPTTDCLQVTAHLAIVRSLLPLDRLSSLNPQHYQPKQSYLKTKWFNNLAAIL